MHLNGKLKSLFEQLSKTFLEKAKYKEAFDLLIEEYYEVFLRHAIGLVSSKDDAQDVLQNAFEKIWKNLSKFQQQSSLFTWAYRIVHNEALMHLRKRKNHVNEDEIQLQAASYPSVYGDDLMNLLQKAIEELPEKQKQVFELRYLENMKYKEIATLTGIEESSLKSQYHYAAKKIKEFVLRHSTN